MLSTADIVADTLAVLGIVATVVFALTKKEDRTRLGVLFGSLIIIVAVGVIVATFVSSPGEPSPPGPGTSSVATEIVSPENDSTVPDIFAVDGTVGNIGDSTLWLFVWGPSIDSAGKNVYFRQSPQSLSLTGGHWSISIGPLGENDPPGTAYTLKLVKAEPNCSAEIASLAQTSHGEYYLPDLPVGCKDVDPPLVVHKR